ncbi:unnamed protein product [Rhizophagus irregularis]|nr:unnamed protein product [Rhizophagus irregularis]
MARWGMSSIVVLLPEELSTRFNGCPMEMIGYWHDDASQEWPLSETQYLKLVVWKGTRWLMLPVESPP